MLHFNMGVQGFFVATSCSYTRRHNYLRISPPLGRAALPRRLDRGEAAASPYQKHPQLLMMFSIESHAH